MTEQSNDSSQATTSMRHERRPRRWLWPALAATGALIVGAGGYAIGAGTSPDETEAAAAGQDSPALTPPSLADGEGAGQNQNPLLPAEGEAQEGLGAAASDLGGAQAADSAWPGFAARRVYSAPSLSEAPGSATGYAFDARAATTPERISALTGALGLSGTPTNEHGALILQPDDPDEPALYVGLDGVASFSYGDWSMDPSSRCQYIYAEVDDSEGDLATEEWEEISQRYEECLQDQRGQLPSADQATAELERLMSDLGFDLRDYAIEVTEQEWDVARVVTARRLVDGVVAYDQLTLHLVAEGIMQLDGQLAEPISLGDYPIISEAEALERLNDVRFGAADVRWLFDVPFAPDGDYVMPTQAPAPPQQGTSVPWWVGEVEITSVEPASVTLWQQDDAALLMPAYQFTATDGMGYVVLAVADEALDFSAP